MGNKTERCEELGALFGMSQGIATRRWIIAVEEGRGHETRIPSSFVPQERLISVAVHHTFCCLVSLCTCDQSPKPATPQLLSGKLFLRPCLWLLGGIPDPLWCFSVSSSLLWAHSWHLKTLEKIIFFSEGL